jgi:Helix-turn-helix domain
MRHVAEHCRLEGAPRALLWAMSYRADRDTAECWAGQRRLAREAGISRKSVERWLPRLVGMGLLELVEEGTGPRPDCYRFSPTWVEGIGSASSVVEGASSATGIVEGEIVQGEVIHNPAATGDMVSPVAGAHDKLVATLLGASGDTVSNRAELVATLGNESGYSQLLLPAETAPKVLKQGSLEARRVQGRNAAGSAADAAGGVAGDLAAADVVSRILRLDPGAVFDPGTAYSGPTITLSDGSVLPNVRRVHEWLASRESAS